MMFKKVFLLFVITVLVSLGGLTLITFMSRQSLVGPSPALRYVVVPRIVTNTVAMKPILTREKDRIIGLDWGYDPKIIARDGWDNEVIWSDGKAIDYFNLEDNDRPSLPKVENIYPIKQVAVSSDGKFLAYTVRKHPVPKHSFYIDESCISKLGDTLLLRERLTGKDTIIYSSTSTLGIGNVRFLPGKHELIFIDEQVYISDTQGTVSILPGIDSDSEKERSIYSGRCDTFAFYAFSPNGRYGLLYNQGNFWASDDVYDFVEHKLLGSFIYPWDFGGEIILGFVDNDQVLVYDHSYSNFVRSEVPRFAIFDVHGKPLMTIATTSEDYSLYDLPNVFATSSLGWHFLLQKNGGGEQSFIFDPTRFSLATSTASPIVAPFDVIKNSDQTSSTIHIQRNIWEKDELFHGPLTDFVVR